MKMRTLYLGDLHGNFDLIHQYVEMYNITDANIIQVGDFGVGFATYERDLLRLKHCNDKIKGRNVVVWAIRGNHDLKPYFDNDPFNLSNIHLVNDYTVLNLDGKNILCIGGAISVDRKRRNDKSWWEDEVLVFNDIVQDITDINILVTHTAPSFCAPIRFNDIVDGYGAIDKNLKTDLLVERQLMNDIFYHIKENNEITNHYYGHFHYSDVTYVDKTCHRLLEVGQLYEERG